jgi:hypothetical protein
LHDFDYSLPKPENQQNRRKPQTQKIKYRR